MDHPEVAGDLKQTSSIVIEGGTVYILEEPGRSGSSPINHETELFEEDLLTETLELDLPINRRKHNGLQEVRTNCEMPYPGNCVKKTD